MIKTELMTKPVTTTTAIADPDGASDEAADSPVEVLNLLHLEDNSADLMLMQEYIGAVLPGATFDSASRLAEVTPERTKAADCALVDLSLPDASGIESVQALRAMSESLPIIVLSGFDNLELSLSAVRFGADDYLIKNHVDSDTLERAIKYSIERRRLMLELASAQVTAVLATADTITANAAAAVTVEQESVSAGSPGAFTPARAAAGTHEVSVRVDDKTGEYALSCHSCDWVAERGLDTVHSWSARSLDQILLHHVGATDRSREELVTVADEASTLPRRGIFSPGGWLHPRV